MIYLQAKRWKVDSTVSRPEIQGFVGVSAEEIYTIKKIDLDFFEE